MLTEKYDFRITDQMTIPLRPHWIANDSYREKCKMLVLNRSKGEIHKVDFSKVTDYIKEGDVIYFNDSTIINHMFICKTRRKKWRTYFCRRNYRYTMPGIRVFDGAQLPQSKFWLDCALYTSRLSTESS